MIPSLFKLVLTAGECITITHEADLTLGGHTFTGAINPFMKLSLLSEGDLYVNEGWKFDSEEGRKRVTPPTGMTFLADMMGVLAFWPQKDLVAQSRSNRGRGTELQPADCRQRYDTGCVRGHRVHF